MKVVDFFCGAGGFSEGFRQQGFEIIHGVDHWQPAIDTFNHNFNLECAKKNILDYEASTLEIGLIPNSEVIIGSPPCISFSNSNRSGKANKSMGLRLTKTFLRVVAVKKFQKDSILKAWYMENVVKSLNHLSDQYTFKDLDLSEWAKQHSYSPSQVAIQIKGNCAILNSAEYGSPQARKRAFVGEIISLRQFVLPRKTHSLDSNEETLPKQSS